MAWRLYMPVEADDYVHMAKHCRALYVASSQIWATAAESSGRSEGSDSVVGNAWPVTIK